MKKVFVIIVNYTDKRITIYIYEESTDNRSRFLRGLERAEIYSFDINGFSD